MLRPDTPAAVRGKIARLLNAKADALWRLGGGGATPTVDVASVRERTGYVTNFEKMVKHIPGEGAYRKDGETFGTLPCYTVDKLKL